MSNQQFCMTCNKSTPYQLTKNKFCGHCGAPFASAQSISSTIPTRSVPKANVNVNRQKYQQIEEDYNEDNQNQDIDIASIASLDVQIIKDKPEPVKLGDIINTGSGEKINRPIPKGSSKQRLKQWQKRNSETSRIDLGGE